MYRRGDCYEFRVWSFGLKGVIFSIPFFIFRVIFLFWGGLACLGLFGSIELDFCEFLKD